MAKKLNLRSPPRNAAVTFVNRSSTPKYNRVAGLCQPNLNAEEAKVRQTFAEGVRKEVNKDPILVKMLQSLFRCLDIFTPFLQS